MPPQINLAELYNIQNKKKTSRLLCFDKILELIHRRIKVVASYNGQNTFYEIPGVMIGYPLYKLTECLNYIVDSLRNNGFLVQILPPPHVAVIYVSWDPTETNNPSQKKLNRIQMQSQNQHSNLITNTSRLLMNNKKMNPITSSENRRLITTKPKKPQLSTYQSPTHSLMSLEQLRLF